MQLQRLSSAFAGGFTASVPTAISTAWNADASLTFITLAYSLAAAAMAPIMGKLGGAIGRRKMLLGAMALYTVGQALIAICPQNVPLLLVFRFMVGIGAAGIAPVVMSYIMMEFPPEKMGRASRSTWRWPAAWSSLDPPSAVSS